MAEQPDLLFDSPCEYPSSQPQSGLTGRASVCVPDKKTVWKIMRFIFWIYLFDDPCEDKYNIIIIIIINNTIIFGDFFITLCWFQWDQPTKGSRNSKGTTNIAARPEWCPTGCCQCTIATRRASRCAEIQEGLKETIKFSVNLQIKYNTNFFLKRLYVNNHIHKI
jgi:hypothetical protein